MGRSIEWGIAMAATLGASSAVAQTAPNVPSRAFTGLYAGGELGAEEHHFFLQRTDPVSGQDDGRYYRAWGFGGGGFAGYDVAIVRRVRLGAELGAIFGGAAPVYRASATATYAQHPLWGVRGTGRAGFLATDRLLVYGTFGYGAEHYRIENSAGVVDDKTGRVEAYRWPSSFTIGAGVDYRLSRRASIRVDFRHLDNSMSHIFIGVPVRF